MLFSHVILSCMEIKRLYANCRPVRGVLSQTDMLYQQSGYAFLPRNPAQLRPAEARYLLQKPDPAKSRAAQTMLVPSLNNCCLCDITAHNAHRQKRKKPCAIRFYRDTYQRREARIISSESFPQIVQY